MADNTPKSLDEGDTATPATKPQTEPNQDCNALEDAQVEAAGEREEVGSPLKPIADQVIEIAGASSGNGLATVFLESHIEGGADGP